MDYSNLSNEELLKLAQKENIISDKKFNYPDDFVNKIIQGDCLEVIKDIPDKSVDCIITDPPYNLLKKQGSLHLFRQTKQEKRNNIIENKFQWDLNFDLSSWLIIAIKKLKKGGNIIIFNDWANMGLLSEVMKQQKCSVKQLGHWQKTNPLPCFFNKL